MEASNIGQYSLVRFTAPSAGIYAISARFEGVHFGLSTTDVHVLHNAAAMEPDHLHLDVRHLVVAPSGAFAITNHESIAAQWLPLDRLDDAAVDPGTVRMVVSALAALDELDL